MAKKNKRHEDRPAGKLRIIGGQWRSRQLPVIDVDGLRPTTDRVRETLFNWLQADIPGAACLDLFAGTGALGFEAASRGAKQVVMIEKSNAAYDVLLKNRKTLQADRVELHHHDAMDYLQQLTSPAEFDIVFLDPPYQSGLLQPVIDKLAVKSGCKVYLELNNKDQISTPENWQLLKDKTAGQIHFCLYQADNESGQ